MKSPASSSNPILECWRGLRSRLLFKFILPRRRRAVLDGVRMDISPLSPMMKNIILTGRYEVQERKFALQALAPEDVVLELGGAIGFIGLLCRKKIGVRHVTSVEANPQTLEMLRANYALNDLQPDVIHAAATAGDGEMDLGVGGEFWCNSVTGPSSQTVRVPARSLASLVRAMPRQPTALICDIEGAEQHLDFTQLPASVKKIIIELHPALVGEAASHEVETRLAALGFKNAGREEDVVLLVRS